LDRHFELAPNSTFEGLNLARSFKMRVGRGRCEGDCAPSVERLTAGYEVVHCLQHRQRIQGDTDLYLDGFPDLGSGQWLDN
jgi:hypothetical protein